MITFSLGALPSLVAAEVGPPSFIKIGVFDSGVGSKHQSKVIGLLVDETIKCKRCKILTFPIYDLNGNLTEERFLAAIAEAKKKGVNVFHFSWNLKSSLSTKKLEQTLSSLIAGGGVIVAAAGESWTRGRRVMRLSETVMGKVPGIFLVGELSRDQVLTVRSNYGPEMTTALNSPVGYKGSSYSSISFTGRIARSLQVLDSTILLKKLKLNKHEAASEWPDLDRLFTGAMGQSSL